MNLHRTLRQKRGISPLIATIILIAICIAGGALVYSIFFSTANTLSSSTQVNVQTASLIKDSAGNVNFTMTVKNVGNKPIDTISITLASEPPAQITAITPLAPLQPGQTASYIPTTAIARTYTVGNTYNVVITAHTTDGSSFAQTVSVMCTMG
ncbi:MAG: archaellin/type IV pilin N-terminal domain-containing protein [Candidatus Bathyarchaeia archaeon]|jgi:flagellin-like protein